MAFKPIDPKRDEFRRYLERSGVIESLTKLFVRLAKERPDNPMDYVRRNLGDAMQQADYTEYLNTELAEARAEITRLCDIIQGIDPFALDMQKNEEDQQNAEPPRQAIEQNGGASIEGNNGTAEVAEAKREDQIVLKKEKEDEEEKRAENAEHPDNAVENVSNTETAAIGEHVPESIPAKTDK